jgi:hypothetical protein
MIAFVDESIRTGPSGVYLVAAAVVIPADLDRARRTVVSALLPNQPRFHWRNESELQRRVMLERVANLPAKVLAYACRPVPRRQDRARALCIDRMLWDFAELGVTKVTFESREEHNDRKDAFTIRNAQRAKRAPATLQYSFARPLEEPLLWLPDALAGAVIADLATQRSSYLSALPEGFVAVVDVEP